MKQIPRRRPFATGRRWRHSIRSRTGAPAGAHLHRGDVRGGIGRRSAAAATVAGGGARGHRHGHRERQLIGTFGTETVKVPRARLVEDEGQDDRVALEGAAALPAADEEGRGADRRGLSRRDQHAAGEAGALRPVRGRGEQGRGQPGLAQGEGRLGSVVRAQPRRRGHRPADPRRHRDQDADRPEGHDHLGARGHRRAPGRAEDPACHQQHGRREQGGLAGVPRRSRCPRPEGARVRHRRWRPRPRGRARRALGGRADPALHGPQAPQPARPCAQAAARRAHRGLPRHDLRRDQGRDRDAPQGVPRANGG